MPSYTVIYNYFRDEEADGYSVVVPALPGIVTWGRTLEEAELNAREALACHIEGMLKDGESLPDDIENAEPVHVEKIQL